MSPPSEKVGGTRPQCPPPNCTHDHVNSMMLGVGTPFQTNTYSHHTSNFQKEEIKTATQDFRISERKRTASFSDYLRFRLGSRCAHPFVVLQIHQVGILPNSGNLVFLKWFDVRKCSLALMSQFGMLLAFFNTAEEKMLFGIMQKPDSVIALFYFSSGTFWPECLAKRVFCFSKCLLNFNHQWLKCV